MYTNLIKMNYLKVIYQNMCLKKVKLFFFMPKEKLKRLSGHSLYMKGLKTKTFIHFLSLTNRPLKWFHIRLRVIKLWQLKQGHAYLKLKDKKEP